MNRLVLMFLKNLPIVPKAMWKLWHYAAHTEEYPEKEKWDHIHYIMKRAIAAGNLELKVTGLENLSASEPFILYGNHQGMFDVVAVAGTCSIPLGVVFKKELSEVPMLKQIIACTKSFAMDRENVRQSLEVIQKVTEEVRNGRNYVIFPEGTRSKKGNDMMEFHGGSFRAAVKSKCTIIPFACIDCFKVLDEKGSKPLTVQLHYLSPIPYSEYEGMKPVEIAALVKSRIQSAIDQNRLPE